MAQQTAVEWFYERVSDLQGTNPYLDMEFEQAKQMEKEQIMNAYDKVSMSTPEQYYNETYGK